MACTKQYLQLAGAGLCTVGGIFGTIAAATATPATGGVSVAGVVAGVAATLGSLLWAISAFMDLADCLEAAGHQAEADRFRQRAHGLQGEYDRLAALAA